MGDVSLMEEVGHCRLCIQRIAELDQLEAALKRAEVDKAVAEAKMEVYEDSLQDIIRELRETRRYITPGL